MKKTKSLLALVLTTMFLVGALGGCGSKSDADNSSASDGGVKKFTAFFATAGKEIPDNNRVKKLITVNNGLLDKLLKKELVLWLRGANIQIL